MPPDEPQRKTLPDGYPAEVVVSLMVLAGLLYIAQRYKHTPRHNTSSAHAAVLQRPSKAPRSGLHWRPLTPKPRK